MTRQRESARAEKEQRQESAKKLKLQPFQADVSVGPNPGCSAIDVKEKRCILNL